MILRNQMLNWKQWYKEQPLLFRLMIVIILLRNIIDIGNKSNIGNINLQEVTAVLSYIIIFIDLLQNNFYATKRRSVTHVSFLMLYTITGIVLLLWLPFNYSFDAASLIGKILFPFFLYKFFLKHVKSRRDLDNILFTILLSSVIPFAILLYEIFFGPIKVQISRGIIRYQGLYEDIFTYSFYTTMFFVIYMYRNVISVRKIKLNDQHI